MEDWPQGDGEGALPAGLWSLGLEGCCPTGLARHTGFLTTSGLFLPCKARRHTCPTSPLLGLSTHPTCPSSSPAPSQQASWRTRSPSQA